MHKYVYDIYGATLLGEKGISHHSYRTIESFRIAQNNPSKLRVVIKSKEKPLDRHAFSGKILAIPLTHGKEATIAQTSHRSHRVKKQVNRVLKKRRGVIVIDAGHGGKDNGASCCKTIREKSIVLSISKKLRAKLEELGYRVYMTRNGDSFIQLPKRTEFANRKKADIFISVHANAAPNKRRAKYFKGIEVYYLSPAQTKRAKAAAEKENSVMFHGKDFYTKNEYLSLLNREKIVESHKLGLDVSHHMVKNAREEYKYVDNGGVKRANFWVLVGAQMPAILVETGYITHKEEGEYLQKDSYQELLADGIAKGIGRYLMNKK